jgi:acyl-CoA thioesterase I
MTPAQICARVRARFGVGIGASARYVAELAARKVAAAALCLALLALPAAAAIAETLRLVALGDSLTHGYGLAQEEGFVPQLQRWLEGQGADVEVVNMGVSGDTTMGGRARLDWALADGADAVIVELGGNDLLRGVDPATSRENLDAMLNELGARDIPVLIAGLEAPLNYGPDYKEAFEGMYADLAEEHGAILYPSFLEGVGPALMQPDGIHPNAEGVAAIVDAIGPAVLDLLERAGS